MRVSDPKKCITACFSSSMLAFLLVLPSCSQVDRDGPINVGFIGQADNLVEEGVRLSPAGQHIRAATSEGLVAFDSSGKIVPRLAERWHVSPDGLYYTFKLRDASWQSGEPITAEDVRVILRNTIGQLDGTSLGLDFAKLTEIRAMTGRVIELRLSSPMPEFLRLLAQPELGLLRLGKGSGPMTLEEVEGSDAVTLLALPPEDLGFPARRDWADFTRQLTLQAIPAESAINQFSDGKIDLLLNGKLSHLPLAELGPLSRGTVQIDPTQGLFGLAFLTSDGLFSDPARREALSMAIDREALIQPFGLAGWQQTSLIVPPDLGAGEGGFEPRWGDMDLEARRLVASERISDWKATSGDNASVRVRLAKGPGNDQLFEQIKRSWSSIGVSAVRVYGDKEADLELRDRIARYLSPRWFLNQFNCGLRAGLCSPQVDELVASTLQIRDPLTKRQVLADAHDALLMEEVYIPFGSPIRWSLVRGSIAAYETNPWGIHPLFPLSQSTN